MAGCGSFLGTKPTEPPFLLKLVMGDCYQDGRLLLRYKLGTPVVVNCQIENVTATRQSFKIKATDNDIFKIKPVMAIVEPNASVPVSITFKAEKPGENFRHFFAFYNMKVPADGTRKVKVYWANGRAEGVARITVKFEEEKEDRK